MPRSYLNRSSSKATTKPEQPIRPAAKAGKGEAKEKDRAKVLGRLRNFDWSKQWGNAYRTLPGTPWRHKRKQTNLNSANATGNGRRRSSYGHRDSVGSVHYRAGESSVFGVPLAQLVLESNSQVPFLVSDVVTYLSSHGLKEEGLFRVSGNARVIEKIRIHIEEEGCPVDFSPFRDDVAAVASILKLFLRELPDAVVPTSVHALFIRAQADNETDIERCVWQLRELINTIPDAERDLLVYLCGFLRTVADHVDTTKMTSKALGIVFGPNIFRCAGGLEGLKEQTYTNHIVEKFIRFHGDIFTDCNLSSVPTSSCDSLDGPRPASADIVLLGEHMKRDVVCPPRLSNTPDGRRANASSRRQSLYRQCSQQSAAALATAAGVACLVNPAEYHFSHPNHCGVNSTNSSSSQSEPEDVQPRTQVQPHLLANKEAVFAPPAKHPFDIDVSPRRDVTPSRYRYSAILPGRVRNAVDRWETVKRRLPAGFDESELSTSCDESQYDHLSTVCPSFSRNITRRPRVAIPSVFLNEARKTPEEDMSTLAKDPDLSPPAFSIPATSLLDDIIKLLETPSKTSGQLGDGEESQDDSRSYRDDFHFSQSHGETTDSGFKSLENIFGGEQRRHRAMSDTRQNDDFPFQSSPHPSIEAVALTAGAHVQRARSLRSEARATRRQFSPMLQQDGRVVPRQHRRSPQPQSYARHSPRQLSTVAHTYSSRHSDSDSSDRCDDTEATVNERASPLRRRGLHRRNARAASFRQAPVVVRRSPRLSLSERRRVQSLPPLERADDSDSTPSHETGHYLGLKRKRQEQDDVQLDADLVKLLHDLQHSRPLSSTSSSRRSRRDSGPLDGDRVSSPAVPQPRRNSTPRSSLIQSQPPLSLRFNADDYTTLPQPSPMSVRSRRTSSSSKPIRTPFETNRGSNVRGSRATSSHEDQIYQVVNYITAKLSMKRALANRPNNFKDMTGDQLMAEKKNIQKCLLQYEAQFGRPSSEAERKMMRPLYEQYRIVKHYLQVSNYSTRYDESPVCEPAIGRSGRPSSSSVSGMGSPARHSKQGRSSQTYVERYMATGMVPPTQQQPSMASVSSYTSLQHTAFGFPQSPNHAKYIRGGMLAATSAVPMTSPMVFSSALAAHNAHAVQSPLWWTTSLQKATRAELLDLQLQVLLEKGQLRKLLKTFEDEFCHHTGRKLTKQDRGRMSAEYDRYKYCKAQLKLLDALLSKPTFSTPQTAL